MKTTDLHRPEGSSPAPCSLIVDVARFMAYANARGRFNAVAESAEKEAIIKSDGDANAHRWQASAKALLSMNGHLNSENAELMDAAPPASDLAHDATAAFHAASGSHSVPKVRLTR